MTEEQRPSGDEAPSQPAGGDDLANLEPAPVEHLEKGIRPSDTRGSGRESKERD